MRNTGIQSKRDRDDSVRRQRMTGLLVAIVCGLWFWHGAGLLPRNYSPSMTAAYAGMPGDLQSRFLDAAGKYERALSRFRQALAEETAAGDSSNLCESPVLLRQVQQCVELHSNAKGLYDRLKSEGDPAAIESSTRIYDELPPVYTAARELSQDDRCDVYSVAVNVARQAAADDEEKRKNGRADRAKFLDELLQDALGDADDAGDTGAEPQTADSKSPTWDAERFTILYRQFKTVSREFKVHARDFLDRLDQLAATVEGHHICEDPTLAYLYAEFWRVGVPLDDAYGSILCLLDPALELTLNTVDPEQHAEMLPSYTHLPIEDQLALVEIQNEYNEDLIVLKFALKELKAKGEGCDAEDLLDRGNRTAEPGQDPETGVDAGAGAGTGGGPIDDGALRFQKTGSVFSQEDLNATCDGGTLEVEVTSGPEFPDQVTPDGTYTMEITITWSASGSGIEDFDLVATVLFLGVFRSSEHVASSTGSQTFTWTFSGSELDFGQPAGVIMVQIAGGILCAGNSSGDVSASYSQAYLRYGSN